MLADDETIFVCIPSNYWEKSRPGRELRNVRDSQSEKKEGEKKV